MFTKRYDLINNVAGWVVFLIALATYWLTLEPTASYWDCGEFIIQADKLEVGHPPGNPIFMLTARFFANFAGDSSTVSVMVNAMSGLLSALTILLLFWTITHLVRRLVVKDGRNEELTLQQYIAVIGSGVVGALAYCWSDTFWFSAVEGEVYAFSSFCTALVFWLILKWENRCDDPHSDRYLILIAYIIGVSVAVHLLNLLCIPAIVLVFAFHKTKNITLGKTLLALLLSFVIVALVLFGLVPGFIKVAQQFELLFVNGFGLSFNSGAIAYGVLTTAVFIWALAELYRQRSAVMIKVSFIAAVAMSGMLFLGSGFLFGWILLALLAGFLFYYYKRELPVRVMSVAMWSIAVIFVGYSSYALILIRSTADTPMNQNSPDNVFDLASYLNREQYGENPLLYGETLYSSPMKRIKTVVADTVYVYEDGTPVTIATPYYETVVEPGKVQYAKGVKGATPVSDYNFLSESEMLSNKRLEQRGGDYYVVKDRKPEVKMNPELNMLFPRIYSRMHRDAYTRWVNLDTVPDNLVMLHAVDEVSGEKMPELDLYAEPTYNEQTGLRYKEKYGYKPTFSQNLSYFFNYQLNHMYLRYFMWNFAGRQNDLLNQQGELDAGNWISGIPFVDNPRLGDQSLLPDELGKDNQGHNVYYMLPLILGILGLLWQAFAGKRGVEQFWVVFFLFFMTGIAIVLYLNQPPSQPRERDYAFAGSFYAFAIWIGMGVAALWRIVKWIMMPKKDAVAAGAAGKEEEPEQLPSLIDEDKKSYKVSVYAAVVAAVIGIAVPLQMVSQTWDDHDRSGRYAARDFGINYLESLEPNAIVFCNGDNDTFPLWYAQEVEGVRPDVRIINLSYLNSDWYANQMRMQSYDSAPVSFTAKPEDYAYSRADVAVVGDETAPADLLSSLKLVYSGNGRDKYGYPAFPSSVVSIPVDKKAVVARGLVAPADTAEIVNDIRIDLRNVPAYISKNYLGLGEILMLDIIATNAAEGWPRPIYWCSTVGDEYHLGLTSYLRSTGMTNQLVPTMQEGMPPRSDRAYDVVTKKYRWGGADTSGKAPYFDETARRMLLTTRSSIVDLASELIYQGDILKAAGNAKGAQTEYKKALEVIGLIENKLQQKVAPYNLSIATTMAQVLCELGEKDRLGDAKVTKRGTDMLWNLLNRFLPYLRYNRDVYMRFGSVSLTPESRLIPYQYYRFVDLYEQYGGKGARAKVEKLLKDSGFNLEELENNYRQAYGDYSSASAGAVAGGSDVEGYTEEIAKYAEIVNELASLPAAEYAARSADEKLIDSIFFDAVEYYESVGGRRSDLEKYEQFKKVDLTRSKRLSDEYHAAKERL